MAKLPKVLFIDHASTILGGAEINLVELLGWPSFQHQFDLTVACAKGCPLDKAISQSARRIQRFDYGFAAGVNRLRLVGRLPSPSKAWAAQQAMRSARRQMKGIIDASEPDVIISCASKDHLCAGPVAKAKATPHLWWVNDIISEAFFAWPVRKFFINRAKAYAKRVICVSQYANQAIVEEGLDRDRVTTIHNGIDVDRFASAKRLSPDGSPTIGLIGRLTPWKGQMLFLEIALAWKAAKHPKVNFRIIGGSFNEDASFRESLMNFVREHNLDDWVTMMDHEANIETALADLDVLVHASTRPEPFGRVIIEAMATGIPVVAANAGGVPEIISHEKDGFLVSPGDRESYLHHLLSLATDQNLSKTIGAQGTLTVRKHFSLERVATDFANLIEESL